MNKREELFKSIGIGGISNASGPRTLITSSTHSSSLSTAISNEMSKRAYGKYNGHNQWDLAVNWFQMSNDAFYDMYGFNFVPRGRLFDEAKSYASKR